MTATRRRSGKRSEILDRDVERKLANDWLQNNDYKARDRIIIAYRPLALAAATEMAKASGMDVEDLAQEAFAALTTALDKFDPELGYRFGTFARWHIQGELNRHVMDFFGPCRIGTNLSDKKVFMQFRKRRAEIEARTGRTLDEIGRQEIADEIGVPIDVVRRMEPRLSSRDPSLDEPIGDPDEGGATRGQMLVDLSPTPEEATIRDKDGRLMAGILCDVMAELSDRERAILSARLLGDKRRQLLDIGDDLGITKERVRQIERRALRHLRAAIENRGFRKTDFIG
jgi:RNA polymerase sigma-32 factor